MIEECDICDEWPCRCSTEDHFTPDAYEALDEALTHMNLHGNAYIVNDGSGSYGPDDGA